MTAVTPRRLQNRSTPSPGRLSGCADLPVRCRRRRPETRAGRRPAPLEGGSVPCKDRILCPLPHPTRRRTMSTRMLLIALGCAGAAGFLGAAGNDKSADTMASAAHNLLAALTAGPARDGHARLPCRRARRLALHPQGTQGALHARHEPRPAPPAPRPAQRLAQPHRLRQDHHRDEPGVRATETRGGRRRQPLHLDAGSAPLPRDVLRRTQRRRRLGLELRGTPRVAQLHRRRRRGDRLHAAVPGRQSAPRPQRPARGPARPGPRGGPGPGAARVPGRRGSASRP